jgi:hypothetical protein
MRRTNRVREKLKSNDGATLMIALLFFLICSLVGVVILASSTTASGRVSSVRQSSSNQRYALNAALDLINRQMKQADKLEIKQSWTAEYTRSDFDPDGQGGYQIGEPSLSKGEWVTMPDGPGWSNLSAYSGSGSGGSFDLEHYVNINAADHTLTSTSGKLKNMGLYRLLLANLIYRHEYEKAAVTPEGTEDSWQAVTNQEVQWSDCLAGDSYEVKSDTPISFAVSDNATAIPVVKADVRMNQNFEMTLHLYCENKDGTTGEERYLTYKPEVNEEGLSSAVVTLTNEDTITKTEQADLTLPDGTVLPNTKETHTASRSVLVTVAWGEGTLSRQEAAE